MEVFLQLADSALPLVEKHLSAEDTLVRMTFTAPAEYQVFQDYFASQLSQKRPVSYSAETVTAAIGFTITRASVEYSDVFRESFFGSYSVTRTLRLEGIISVERGTVVTEPFSFNRTETVPYDDLQELEKSTFPFATGKMPEEPVFGSILEPVLYLGAAATAVLLFFTVRGE